MKSLSCVRLFMTSWTVTYQAPLSMGFSRQEYWSGLPFPFPIFLTQRSNPDLPHCRQMLYGLSHWGRLVIFKPQERQQIIIPEECQWDFPGGPVVKTSPSNAENRGSIPGWGAKIPHALCPLQKPQTEAIL